MNRNLRRVRANVGPLVLLFCAARGVGGRFALWELESHIQSETSATPGSAARVLRQLRKQGAVNYRVRCGVYEVCDLSTLRVVEALAQKQLFKFCE